MSEPIRGRRSVPSQLRHPAELPCYVFMVVLNLVIIAAIIRFALVLPFVPSRFQDSSCSSLRWEVGSQQKIA